ncbi:MAG: hypothetical protein ACFFB5_15045 [Promethearchaeota archaeon]
MIEEIIILVFAIIGILIIIKLAAIKGGEEEDWRRINVRGKTRAMSFDRYGKIKRNKSWSDFTKQRLASSRVKKETKKAITDVVSPTRNYNRVKKTTKLGRDIYTMSGGSGFTSFFLTIAFIIFLLMIIFGRI